VIPLAFDADTYGAFVFISGGLAIAAVFIVATAINVITEKLHARKDQNR
jgi:hypothetical protein